MAELEEIDYSISSAPAGDYQVEKFSESLGQEPTRPKFWGGFRIVPAEIEFWAEGESRLHDRFLWTKSSVDGPWSIQRLYP